MRPLIVLCFILLLFNNWNLIEAQIPIIQWQGVYGGTENEEGLSVIVKTDSTIIIAGSAESSNGIVSNHHHPTLVANDIWLIQLTNSGQVIWNKCFGGASDDEAHAIKLDNDNGYVFCGLTGSNDGDVIGGFHGYVDAWVVKIDSNAIIQWQKCFGGTQNDYANDVIQTSDSGYLVTGLTSSPDGDGIGYHGGGGDLLVIKLNKQGTKQWVKVLGGSGRDEGISCQQTNDGGFLILGNAHSNNGDVIGLHNNSEDVWVLKLDSIGQIIWQKCYGGSSIEFASKIILSNDGGFYVCAAASSSDGDVDTLYGQKDFWFFKADSLGSIIWQKSFGGSFSEVLYNATPTNDGGFLLGGYSTSDNGMVIGTHGGFYDCWVIKIDSIGNYEWGKCLGGSGDEKAYLISNAPDGGYIVGGYTTSTDGDVTTNWGKEDLWVVKLSPPSLIIPELDDLIMDLNIVQYDNDLNLRFFSNFKKKLNVFVYDQTGKQVIKKNISVNEGINYTQINCDGISKGLYVLKIDGERNSMHSKVFIH